MEINVIVIKCMLSAIKAQIKSIICYLLFLMNYDLDCNTSIQIVEQLV